MLISSCDAECAVRTLQAVLQAVLHHYEELLQRCIVRVERAAQVESGLDQALDAQLGHVHQVKPLDGDGILRIWSEKTEKESFTVKVMTWIHGVTAAVTQDRTY